MTEHLIQCKNVNLTIPVYKNRKILSINPLNLFSSFYGNKGSRSEKILLNNINFTLMEGDTVGIMGNNGAGKTTLLRLLAGVYQPSNGTITAHGKTYGLFNVHVGMKAEATGMENIYLRGLQMGMKFKDIKLAISEVLKFAEIGDAIYDPISSYSNGMRMRLALAVSTMINPDILLLDEWIGAGDQEFREKINLRMMELVENSKGLVIATHNKVLMKRLCNKGIVMKDGKIEFFGNIDNALQFRQAQVARHNSASTQSPPHPKT